MVDAQGRGRNRGNRCEPRRNRPNLRSATGMRSRNFGYGQGFAVRAHSRCGATKFVCCAKKRSRRKGGRGTGLQSFGLMGKTGKKEPATLPMIASFGKTLVVVGLVLTGLGLVLVLVGRLDILRTLWERLPLGRLPGDIHLQRKDYSVFPLGHLPGDQCSWSA